MYYIVDSVAVNSKHLFYIRQVTLYPGELTVDYTYPKCSSISELAKSKLIGLEMFLPSISIPVCLEPYQYKEVKT